MLLLAFQNFIVPVLLNGTNSVVRVQLFSENESNLPLHHYFKIQN